MGISTAPGSMTSEEIVALSREHTFFSWSVQGAVDPIPIDHAEGVYLYTPDGKRILDFNSQLMSVNIGHGNRRVVDAITEQALKLQYVQPAFVTEPRARLGQKLAGILIPPDGYIRGVRDLCDKYGILMVADEVMAGFGRTGRWFAIDHWDVTPDLMTMAKGLTSSYLPLGAVAMRHHIAEKFDSMMY